ncbi:NAD-P-binding protein [Mycena albidolilacea]|uniref:NAD-P-binding protein n=1 Tax=Mycena albidolilacea TaxID=1033008 RepID=A0AAD7F2U4_9AGAR|nr:NAD-P-binding protein [Mycena albidolilacea]
MPPLAQALKLNASFLPKAPKPVALFVGGTSGIGQAMARRFAEYTKGESHIIVVGRNHAAARATISSFPNSKLGTYEFVECDATLMQNVGTTTAALRAHISKLNFLVLSPGFFSIIAGRDETAEGLDKKLALLYYARWKFIYDLMPLLQNAAASAEDAKVYSVLGAGTGSAIDLDDLGLKKRYSALKAATAAATYTDLMMEKFATTNPQVQFTHAFPGLVRTPMMRPKHWVLKPLAPLISVASYPFTVTPEVILVLLTPISVIAWELMYVFIPRY